MWGSVSHAILHVDQVMLEALSSKRTFITEPHRGALQDMEEYFGVKGLLNNSASITYKRHNTRVHAAVQVAAAAWSAGSHACVHCVYTSLVHERRPKLSGYAFATISAVCRFSL